MGFILHCGGKTVSYDEACRVPLPQETRSYKPVGHGTIIDMVEEPLVFIVGAVGIYSGLRMLILPEMVDKWIGIVVQVLVVLAMGWLATRLIDALFKELVIPLTEKSETALDDQLAPLALKAAKFVIWGVTVVIAMNNAGYDVGALLAGLGIGGLAVAMAAKDTVTNIFGGFTIFTDRPFSRANRLARWCSTWA